MSRTTFAMDPVVVEGLLAQVASNAPGPEDEGTKDESSKQADKSQSSKKKKDRKQTGDRPTTTGRLPEAPDGPPDGFSP